MMSGSNQQQARGQEWSESRDQHRSGEGYAGVGSDQDGEFIPTRKSLLGRLADWEDHASWRTFFDTYWKLFYSVAIKSGLHDHEAQDVVQETVIAVSRNIQRFKYDPAVCSFKTWLMQITRSRISNQFRRRRRHPEDLPEVPEDSSQRPFLEQIADPAAAPLEGLWEAEWQKNLVDAALARVKQQVEVRQYQMFDLYVLRQWPVGKVAKSLNVSAARVYLAKHRVSKLIRKEVMAIETQHL